MLQIHLDTVFHAHRPIMSKIRYALCAWGGFLTQTQKGMINAFLRRMCKYRYHFVSVCFDIDAVMVDIGRKFFKVLFFPAHCLHSLLPPVKSNPNGLRSRDHNFQLPVCNFNFRRNSFIIRSLPPLRSTQLCIPPGSLNRVPASAGVTAGMSPLPGGR